MLPIKRKILQHVWESFRCITMGKRILSQRRGKGSQTYTATNRAITKIQYPDIKVTQEKELRAQIIDFVIDPIRSAILAEIMYADATKDYVVAAEGLHLHDTIQFGANADIKLGNVLPLSSIPEGAPIFALERRPGDGGNMVRASGQYAVVLSKEEKKAFIKLPSSKVVSFDLRCRASIGNVACGGRTDKPLLKAGARFHALKAKGKRYPFVRGVAMNPLKHPFGGSQHHAGKSKSTSRHAPPGRKVGAIASRRTGRKKK
jgi:large subunit ribosomal protein L2